MLSLCHLLFHSYKYSLSHTHKHALAPNHSQRHTLSFSHTVPLSHTRFCSPTLSPTYQSFTHPPILILTLLCDLSLSLSLWCVRACVRACPSLLLSLAFAFAFSLRLSLSLSLSLLHTHSHTRSHALSLFTHSHTHTQTRSLSPSFSHTHSHFFLSLSLSLSLSYTHAQTPTHIRTHTFSHLFTCPPTHSLLSRVRTALFSARVRAHDLSSLFLSPFLPFSFFSFLSISLRLSSSPLFTCLLAVFLSLVRFLSFSTPGSHDFNLKQSWSHCDFILAHSCSWHFLSYGTVYIYVHVHIAIKHSGNMPTNRICRLVPRSTREQNRITNEIVYPRMVYLLFQAL